MIPEYVLEAAHRHRMRKDFPDTQQQSTPESDASLLADFLEQHLHRQTCSCWLSDNTLPGGVCRSCGKWCDIKARQPSADIFCEIARRIENEEIVD